MGHTTNETSNSSYGAEQDLDISEWSKKPFVMPPDDEVFRIRALEKNERDRKSGEKTLPVSQKTTFASRMAATITSDKFKKELAEIDAQVTKEVEQMKSAIILPMEHYHKEKENMAEFIAKKREIFLVQMSLDNKRAEIRKLEDRIFQREEALRKSEEMLEEDTLHFEAFLKQNDEKVQEAIRKAEQQTRLKQEKLAEIKKLNAEIATTKKELNKFQEQLEECKKYKDFLIDLTPKEWLEEERGKSLQLKNAESTSEATENPSENTIKGAEETVSKGSTRNNDEKDISEEDSQRLLEPMYFKSTNQLLEIFSELEEKNLALLQESEDVESALEDLKTRFNETRTKSEARIANLRDQLKAPIPKRIGKPAMFRSWLIKNTTKTHHVEKIDEILANEIAEFLARDY